ncbi:MAG: hypothetical protein CMD20_02260 [Flavobacteriales bacterium]|jgi:hypothetical protein|nr:hypothetical protein [Flavobacteriales bacterium]|tara:strand:+ start:643 stop:1356 length:714 start_codon:yes stop_codon:yes gene_type:complete
MARKRRKKSKNYFTQDTEDAIVLYNNTSDPEKRSKIYEARIHYAFFKLTENIIHTFKFYHTEVNNLEHLQHEIITFLLTKMHLFDPSKGAKAYSYFGTIVKRWLILYNTKNYNKKIKKVPTDTLLKENSTYVWNNVDNYNKKKDELSEYIDLFVDYTTENILELFPKKNDAQIADAILELFRKREVLEVFNKKALYIYIREMVEVKTPKITKIADKLYDIFKSNYIHFLEHGYTRFQ